MSEATDFATERRQRELRNSQPLVVDWVSVFTWMVAVLVVSVWLRIIVLAVQLWK